MRKKWRSDKRMYKCGDVKMCKFICTSAHILICTFIISFTISCNKKEEHKHIPNTTTTNLDGLAQPANQTVFSDVKTISPIFKTIKPILNATGVVSYDTRLLNNISARFSGRIEKLYVRFNFQNVSKGQRIMDIYSPEILTEQQNLIYLLNSPNQENELINSSKQKLQLLGLTYDQLKQISSTHQPINPLPIYSLYSGHIHDIGISGDVSASSPSMNGGMNSNKNVSASSQIQIENLPSSQTSALSIKEGMYVQSGQTLFAVYNIDKVWAVLNIYPRDAAQIDVDDKVSISTETNPENKIESTISYIEPVTGQNAYAIKARVYLQNAKDMHLEIGTLLTAKISSKEIKGIWLPRNAVVNLGQKQIVFLKSENHFISKNIQTGIVMDSLVQIISGLKGDEKIAVNAQFMVDSESFILTNDDGK